MTSLSIARRRIIQRGAAVVGALALGGPLTAAPGPEPSPSAMQRMLQAGPEAQRLALQVGTWDVVMTIRPSPTTAPVVVRGIVAERTMIGLYLSEVMKPAPGADLTDFRRIDYMTYDPVQARWEYASMDTRAPIGIMFAKSYPNERGAEITVYFDNFADPGLGAVFGGSVRARHVDKLESDGRHLKQQYWTRPDQQEWLAVQYDYTQRR